MGSYLRGWWGRSVIDHDNIGIIVMKTQMDLLERLNDHIRASDTSRTEIKLTIENGRWAFEFGTPIHPRMDRGNPGAEPYNSIHHTPQHIHNPDDVDHNPGPMLAKLDALKALI